MNSAAPGLNSSVLAVVPHYRCEEWLAQCLHSLERQSRPPDGIVVIDDASDAPPQEIVQMFPGVTLMSAEENVGQYRLVQQVIDETSYDAYLFQDADDWSHPDRLRTLLTQAAAKGAELVGSNEVRVSNDGEHTRVAYPEDVNETLAMDPGAFALLLCTSLVSGRLVRRVGGLAGGMRICGDYDFILRAHHAGKVANVPQGLYYRRIHPGSLTSRPETGFGSDLRMEIHRLLIQRDQKNARMKKSGDAPDLSPFAVASPVGLTRLCGPALQGPQSLIQNAGRMTSSSRDRR